MAFITLWMKVACSSTKRRRNFKPLSTNSVIFGTGARNCGRSGRYRAIGSATLPA
jgi:hypothetical protein